MELWKEPSVIGGQVDMRVAPASTTSLLQMLTDAGIPHHIIADDLHRFSYTSCTRVAIQNTVRVTAILVSDSLSFRLSVRHYQTQQLAKIFGTFQGLFQRILLQYQMKKRSERCKHCAPKIFSRRRPPPGGRTAKI